MSQSRNSAADRTSTCANPSVGIMSCPSSTNALQDAGEKQQVNAHDRDVACATLPDGDDDRAGRDQTRCRASPRSCVTCKPWTERRLTTANRADAARDPDRSVIVPPPSPILSNAARAGAGSQNGHDRSRDKSAKDQADDHSTDQVPTGNNPALVICNQHQRIRAETTGTSADQDLCSTSALSHRIPP